MKHVVRKRRTPEHILADLSVNHVERQALLCGYSVERMSHDYGIDLELFTYNSTGETEEGQILLQLKASKKFKIQSDNKSLILRIDRRDLVAWLAQPMPVILIAYDVKANRAYWLYLQSHFAKRKDFNLFAAGQEITVHVPLDNVVNPAAVRRFARFRNRVLAQMRGLRHDES
jgi:hypothetical protein